MTAHSHIDICANENKVWESFHRNGDGVNRLVVVIVNEVKGMMALMSSTSSLYFSSFVMNDCIIIIYGCNK
jgi:hypothetical protein